MGSVIEFIKLIKNKVYVAIAIMILIFLGNKYKKMKDLEKKNIVLKNDKYKLLNKVDRLVANVEKVATINNENIKILKAKAEKEKRLKEIDVEISNVEKLLSDGLILINDRYRLIKKYEHDKRILKDELDNME